MRLRLPSIAFLALIVPVAGMAAIAACGDTTDTGDAGPDATADVAKDVAPDVAPVTDAGCANDVDLTQFLPSADASIDVDAGGLNISEYTGCLKTNCGTDINACNGDCDCRQAIVDAITCIAQGGSFQLCGGPALSNAKAGALFACALGSCSAQCLPSDGGIPKDAASTDAADGG